MTERPVEWAARLAQEHLDELGLRWSHTLGVVEQASALAPILTERDLDVLVAAAYLHDIGYAPPLAATGFHPLDGARYLCALGHERLASLVAFHSGARAEADERGLATELAEFREEDSLVARALTYCDLVTGPDGARVSLDARLSDLSRRYDAGSPVGQAVRRSAASFHEIVSELNGILESARESMESMAPSLRMPSPGSLSA